MAFIRDTWYAAAWSEDISRVLLSRTLLNEQILFYRKEDGTPCAIFDRCPHRFLPLSMGKLVGDNIECAYHGLRFNCSGECVLNPHGAGVIPKAATVRSYPLTEQYGLVWIWMGNPDNADPSLVPDYHWLTDTARYSAVHGTIHMNASYLLLLDNLTDLTHAPFIHETTLGSPGAARAKVEVIEENDQVWTKQFVPDSPIPAVFQLISGSTDNMDHWIEMRCDPPGCMITMTGVTPSGRPREEGWGTYNPNIITPETDSTTHYFWAGGRDFELDNDELSANIKKTVDIAFNHEDRPAIEAQQKVLNGRELMDLNPVLLPNDGGSVRARRIIERRIKAEQSRLPVEATSLAV